MLRATQFHQSIHLNRDQLIRASTWCPVCGTHNLRQTVAHVQRDPDVSLLHCFNCLSCSTSHIALPEVLDEYYRSYYDHRSDCVAFHDPHRFARHLSKWVNIETLKSADGALRICDFGGGDGSLAIAVATQLGVYCSIDVVDYPSNTIQSTELIDITYFESIDATDGHYNLILASAVLEHMVYPRETIDKLFLAIEPDGFLYARTPFVLPFLQFVPSFDFHFPGHLHDLGPAFWNRAIHTYGWRATLISSRPSIVETNFRNRPFRTSVAYAIKLPAFLQLSLQRSHDRVPLWPFVGGWEVVLQATN